MPRKRRRKTRKGVPIRIKVLVAFLLVVFVAGVGSVKLFRTPRGQAILLDAGFSDYYALVQQALDVELRGTLESFDLHKHLREGSEGTIIGTKSYVVRHWETSCSAKCSSAKISLAFAKAANRAGGIARSQVEAGTSAGGEEIIITAGSRKYPTHRITVRTSRPALKHSRTLTARVEAPKLALVIDDFGYSKSELTEKFFEFDLPLTISVIPSLPRTRYSITRARDTHKQAILHLPMEAENSEPGEGFVLTSMSDRRIRKLLEGYLDDTPGVVGVNNHFGSLATQDKRVMRAVISVIKDHDLFFLDSLTSSESIAYNTAREMSVPTAKNTLFLDDDTEDPLVVEGRLLRLVALAKKRGSAVGIGHPKRWTFEAISRNEHVLKDSGVDLVFISEIVE